MTYETTYGLWTEPNGGKYHVPPNALVEAAENLLLSLGYAINPPSKPLTFEDVAPMTEAPPVGTEYWAVHPFGENGVMRTHWDGAAMDKSAVRRRVAYRKKEHAIVAAAHIFGLKGGTFT